MRTAEAQVREQNDALADRDENIEALVVEFSALASDDSRHVVDAAQIMLRGNQQEIRSLCKPWGV